MTGVQTCALPISGLVQIGDGSMEEERRVCGGRKKRWRGSEERDTGK